jgi:hypothetical protein
MMGRKKLYSSGAERVAAFRARRRTEQLHKDQEEAARRHERKMLAERCFLADWRLLIHKQGPSMQAALLKVKDHLELEYLCAWAENHAGE